MTTRNSDGTDRGPAVAIVPTARRSAASRASWSVRAVATTALLLAGGAASAAAGDLGLSERLDRMARGLFIGPIRFRHEYRDDHDFRRDVDDSDNRDLLKVRGGLDARPLDPIRVRVQLGMTRSWGRNKVDRQAKIDAFGQDQIDLFEGFCEVGPFPGVPVSVRVGRQVLAYGEERLVGPLEFVQNARTWDAVKVLFGWDGLSIDAWWGRLVLFEGPDDHNFNRPIDTTDFFGVYASARPWPGLLVEPFYLVKLDDNTRIRGEKRRTGHLVRHSPGLRLVWSGPHGLRLGADGAIQTGERGRDDILAWAVATKATWAAPQALRPLGELEIEYAFGSGDEDPSDGDAGTFDNFYPTNHKFYGEMDLVGWQNIHAVELTARFHIHTVRLRDPPPERPPGTPRPYLWERAREAALPTTLPIALEAGWHFFWLAEARDAWYSAALRPVRRDATGRAGRELGQELDLVLRAGPIALGYAHFFPGSFIERTTPSGGRASGADLFYAEASVSF